MEVVIMDPFAQRKLINIYEVAKILDLSVQTIRNKLCAGSFPIAPKKLGGALKWDTKDIGEFLDNLKPTKAKKNID
jgi:predicted DNA-binding transcriptional regulator AlpA